MGRMDKELLVALEAGDVVAIQRFHELNGDVLNGVTFRGDTALHIASRKGHLDLVTWLLELDPSVAKAKNEDGNAPLQEAAKSGNTELVRVLLQFEHNRYNKFKETALMIASQYDHVGTVELLLEAASFVDRYEWDQSVREAAYRGYEGVVVALLDKGRPKQSFASFNDVISNFIDSYLKDSTDQGVETPILHRAVQGGHLDIVRAMLNHYLWRNDSMTEKDEYGRCAVHVAAMKGCWEIIKEFMSRMPDSIQIRSSDGKSVLHFAVEYDQFDVVKGLLAKEEVEKVVEMVSRDHDLSGNTSLHFAAINGVNPQLLECLLSPPDVDVNTLTLNLNALNDEGMSALDIALSASQDNLNCAYIVHRLEAAGVIRSSVTPKSHSKSSPKSNGSKKEIDTDTVNTHMVVASLIATITFAAIFQIPGGIEDDKESIHYGAAKLAFGKVFRLFLFSDTVAFLASLTVVVGWLLREHLHESRSRRLVSSYSEASLLVSIFWTVVAFVTATITVMIPHNLDGLKVKDKEAFSKYERLWGYAISLLPLTPYLVLNSIAILFRFLYVPLSRTANILILISAQMLYLVIFVLAFTFT